jgi:hypothetical protein
VEAIDRGVCCWLSGEAEQLEILSATINISYPHISLVNSSISCSVVIGIHWFKSCWCNFEIMMQKACLSVGHSHARVHRLSLCQLQISPPTREMRQLTLVLDTVIQLPPYSGSVTDRPVFRRYHNFKWSSFFDNSARCRAGVTMHWKTRSGAWKHGQHSDTVPYVHVAEWC